MDGFPAASVVDFDSDRAVIEGTLAKRLDPVNKSPGRTGPTAKQKRKS